MNNKTKLSFISAIAMVAASAVNPVEQHTSKLGFVSNGMGNSSRNTKLAKRTREARKRNRKVKTKMRRESRK